MIVRRRSTSPRRKAACCRRSTGAAQALHGTTHLRVSGKPISLHPSRSPAVGRRCSIDDRETREREALGRDGSEERSESVVYAAFGRGCGDRALRSVEQAARRARTWRIASRSRLSAIRIPHLCVATPASRSRVRGSGIAAVAYRGRPRVAVGVLFRATAGAALEGRQLRWAFRWAERSAT